MSYITSPSWATVCKKTQKKEEIPVLELPNQKSTEELHPIELPKSEEPLKIFTSCEWFRWYKSWRDMLNFELNTLNNSLQYYESRRWKMNSESRLREVFDIRWRICEVNKELRYVNDQIIIYRNIVNSEYPYKNTQNEYSHGDKYDNEYDNEYDNDYDSIS